MHRNEVGSVVFIFSAALSFLSVPPALRAQSISEAESEQAEGLIPSSIPKEPESTLRGGGPSGDMTFCQLYGLQQFGRSGSTVGLALATTSWNVGNKDLKWFGYPPGTEHPFIVMNMFRLKDGRFEQIGQSWVKHGFFALGDEQCGGNCTYEALPGHGVGNWLGKGCTDTYTSGLNADQSGLGPRSEVNPWTGAWVGTGSHLSSGHSHTNGIQHRLQVHDDDLNPAINTGAQYFAEGYYVVGDDTAETMNNAAWKTVSISAGSPGGTWSFSMSGAAIDPNIGFAYDAWTGTRQTVIAVEVPVDEANSPDGRCVLSARATQIDVALWHYEYALYNVDMDRKVGSFSIPLPFDAVVSNVDFHAVNSHNETYSNTPWTPVVTSSSVTWSTTNNPLRWGTLYNFRFDTTVPPAGLVPPAAGVNQDDPEVTIGLFEPGTPTFLTAPTIGPRLQNPVPAVSTWGLAGLGLLLLTGGSLILRRRIQGSSPQSASAF